jgi:hypothetical protein
LQRPRALAERPPAVSSELHASQCGTESRQRATFQDRRVRNSCVRYSACFPQRRHGRRCRWRSRSRGTIGGLPQRPRQWAQASMPATDASPATPSMSTETVFLSMPLGAERVPQRLSCLPRRCGNWRQLAIAWRMANCCTSRLFQRALSARSGRSRPTGFGCASWTRSWAPWGGFPAALRVGGNSSGLNGACIQTALASCSSSRRFRWGLKVAMLGGLRTCVSGSKWRTALTPSHRTNHAECTALAAMMSVQLLHLKKCNSCTTLRSCQQ